MRTFQIILVVLFASIFVYSFQVIVNFGWDFLDLFFKPITEVTWTGQFNLDFSLFVFLTIVWIAWRHQFTPKGIGLALLSVVGMVYVAPYILVASIQAKGDVKELLLGKARSHQQD
ncbi:MAG: hypothetical protein ACPGJS_05605 [Flammeovirgaceae bacterium]